MSWCGNRTPKKHRLPHGIGIMISWQLLSTVALRPEKHCVRMVHQLAASIGSICFHGDAFHWRTNLHEEAVMY